MRHIRSPPSYCLFKGKFFENYFIIFTNIYCDLETILCITRDITNCINHCLFFLFFVFFFEIWQADKSIFKIPQTTLEVSPPSLEKSGGKTRTLIIKNAQVWNNYLSCLKVPMWQLLFLRSWKVVLKLYVVYIYIKYFHAAVGFYWVKHYQFKLKSNAIPLFALAHHLSTVFYIYLIETIINCLFVNVRKILPL